MHIGREIIVEDPTTGGKKASKLCQPHQIPVESLWALAEHYGKAGGNGEPSTEKYEPGNWRKGYKWYLSFDAAIRHLWRFWWGEDIDPDTGTHHVICAAWHCMNLYWFWTHKLQFDDRREKSGLPPEEPCTSA